MLSCSRLGKGSLEENVIIFLEDGEVFGGAVGVSVERFM